MRGIDDKKIATACNSYRRVFKNRRALLDPSGIRATVRANQPFSTSEDRVSGFNGI